MNHEIDVDRVIRAWLADGPDVLADRVLETTRERIRHTPQRRGLGARLGNPQMRLFRRAGAVAAVAAVFVVAGSGALLVSQLGPRQGGGGLASPVATDSAPSPAASPIPGASAPSPADPTPPAPPTVSPAPDVSTGPTAEFAGGGLRFRYPAGWTRIPVAGISTMGSTITVLGAAGMAAACPRPSDVNCIYGYHLAPGEVRLIVGTGARPMGDFLAERPADAARFMVDGLPGYMTTRPECFGATECRDAVLAMPGSVNNWYLFHMSLAAPGLDSDRAAFDALLASTHYEGSVERLPRDPSAPAEVLRRVLAENAAYAIEAGYQLPDYGCFPAEPGMTRTATISIRAGGPPDTGSHRLEVRCTSAIEPTELELWRVTLTTAWDAGPGRTAGSSVETDWVKPDGGRAGTYQTGDDFPR